MFTRTSGSISRAAHLVGGGADALGNISVVTDGDVGLLIQTHDLCSQQSASVSHRQQLPLMELCFSAMEQPWINLAHSA